LAQQLRETGGLVQRVPGQTRLLSLFEPHTEAVRKGKAVKPTEFGKLVKILEAEAQFTRSASGENRRMRRRGGSNPAPLGIDSSTITFAPGSS
jgi:hypothetical protein